ncbi:hypothetical protein ARMGADRAFT_1035687 [Armillaria gallica]|uniref:Uncharacterized protein n=1 Tax=Armillaria gallica TaxID=47427 RepID=A0A2H3DDA7_ARMGA|nr:hypothetical protein ARMGADRAFT_1035687 [Armillaria gallica]
MLWANALHDMSLDMVLSKATLLSEAPSPIPDLRFLEAAMVMKSRPDSERLKDWLGFCVLVERLLSTDDFAKYHVQYHFTKGKAFVSDYQELWDISCLWKDPSNASENSIFATVGASGLNYRIPEQFE